MDSDVDGMLTELENTPLAERARNVILKAILSGRFDDNRLPSEDELAKMLNVSRTTIRTALHSLEQDGIITRRRAVGTTINSHVGPHTLRRAVAPTINRHAGPSTLALQRLIGFDWLLEEKGHTVRVDQAWKRTKPAAGMVAALAVDREMESVLTEKLYYADDHLAIYVRDLIQSDLIEDELPETPAA